MRDSEKMELIPPFPIFGPGAENFPSSDELPEGVISVKWTDRQDAGMVDIKPNVVYQSLSGEDQILHLVTPSTMFAFPGMPAPSYPLVINIPGSAWHRQNLWDGLDKARYFAGRGYAFAIVGYRPTDIGAAFPSQRDDVLAAVRFLIDNASKFCINPEKIAIWGDSSGGHTAVSAAAVVPELFRCAVDWYGTTDITKMNYYPSAMDHIGADSPEGMLIGGKNVLENPDISGKVSPLEYISKEKPFPPLLMMHGSSDNLVPFNQSVRLYEKLLECEKNVVFYKLEGGAHGSGGFLSDEAFHTVFEFVSTYLA